MPKAAACDPIPYREFKVFGSDPFTEVRDLLAAEQNQAKEAGLYMFVSRSTVLGRMKEIKEREYRSYLADLEKQCATEFEFGGVPREPGDIF